jgi:hypothetical protein
MQKVKIFSGLENDVQGLEGEINRWLEQSGARIVSLVGNIAPQSGGGQTLAAGNPSDILVMVLYEEGHE